MARSEVPSPTGTPAPRGRVLEMREAAITQAASATAPMAAWGRGGQTPPSYATQPGYGMFQPNPGTQPLLQLAQMHQPQQGQPLNVSNPLYRPQQNFAEGGIVGQQPDDPNMLQRMMGSAAEAYRQRLWQMYFAKQPRSYFDDQPMGEGPKPFGSEYYTREYPLGEPAYDSAGQRQMELFQDAISGGNRQSQELANGGIVQGQGGPTSDNQRINASPGEGILNVGAMRLLGPQALHALNRMGMGLLGR